MKADPVHDSTTSRAGIGLVVLVLVALGGGFLAGWVQRHGVLEGEAARGRERADVQAGDQRLAARVEAARSCARALDDAWVWRLRRHHVALVERALARAAGVGDADDAKRPADDVLTEAIEKLRALVADLPPVEELAAALDSWVVLEREQRAVAVASSLDLLARALDPEPRRLELRELLATANAGRLRDLADAADVTRDPAPTVSLLVKALASAGLADVAVRLGERRLAEHADDAALQLLVGDLLFERGPAAVAAARRHYTAAIALAPGSLRAWAHHGWLLADQARDGGAAIALTEAATRRFPASAALAYVRGYALARSRHFAEARQVLAQALALDPRCALAQAAIGDALVGRDGGDPLVIEPSESPSSGGERGSDRAPDRGIVEQAWRELLERAKEAYEQSLRLFDTPDARTGLAAVFWTQGDRASATALLDESVRRHPDDALLRDLYAGTLLQRGSFAEAIAQLREAVRLDEWSDGAQNDYAWELANGGDARLRRPGQAVDHARRACELDPGNPSYRNTLGVALYRIGEWEQCIAELETACRLPRGGGAFDHFFLAMANWQLGRAEVARDHYERALALKTSADGEIDRVQLEAMELFRLQGSGK